MVVAATSAEAQERAVVTTSENFRLEPSGGGRVLARVNEGAEVVLGASRGGWREVTLQGWIWGASVRNSSSEGFDLAVAASGGENLRVEPNGTIVARLESGALLQQVRRADQWVEVRRTAWMWERSLERVAAAPTRAAPPAPAPGAGAGGGEPADAGARALEQNALLPGTRLLAAPDGDTLARLGAGGRARVQARADGWARVLVEAWVREADLAPLDDSALVGVTAAEVRGGGAAYEGRVLRWTVQVIAIQTADELRRDMPAGQRYLLGRGPLPETGFVYVLLTPAQARALEELEPLTRLTMRARVRRARSQYLGNPVLDLLDYTIERER